MKTPIRLAVAAVIAQAPRLLLATAGIYGAPVPSSVRLFLALVSSLASAAVLTGGCAYLAHAIAVAPRHRGLLSLFWGLAAVATIIILSPEIVAAIPKTHLSQVLSGPRSRWVFAITLAGFAEVVASGLAIAAASTPAEEAPPGSSELISLGLAALPQVRAELAQPVALPAAPQAAAVRTCDACGRTHRDSPQGKAAHARYCTGRSTTLR